MKRKIYIYRLTDAHGNKDIVVLNDLSQCEPIAGYDKDGVYHQYDSYELYHAYAWAEERGFTLDYATVEIEITDAIFERKE